METAVSQETDLVSTHWTRVQETWEELRNALDGYFGHRIEKADFIHDLNIHTSTLYRFIESYIGPSPTVTDMEEAYRMVSGMHRQSIIAYAEKMDFDIQNLAFMSPLDIEEKVSEIYDQWHGVDTSLQDTASCKINNLLTENLFANIDGLKIGFERQQQSKGRVAAFLHAFHI
jgi:hypothetical protein